MNSSTTDAKLPKLKTVAIIQARLGSTRLPGKVLKDLAGKPVLWHVIDRLEYCHEVDEIVIATTDLPQDDELVAKGAEWNIPVFRGSSSNVLSRYYEAAKQFKADILVRITSDCPVIDPQIVDQIVATFKKFNKFTSSVDYLSNTQTRCYPRGLDTEVFSWQALLKAQEEASKEYEKEHVTPYLYQHPELFRIRQYIASENHADLRWTLDTDEDYQLISEIYKKLYRSDELFLYEDILKLLEENPALTQINAHVEQKALGSY